MMLFTAILLTPWVGVGTYEDPYRPLLADAVPGVQRWQDLTQEEILPDPNLAELEILCDEAVLVTIEADARFFVLSSSEVVEVVEEVVIEEVV